MAIILTTPVYAGQWRVDSTGWWYQENNGNYPRNTWKAIDGSWYYFYSNGYMAHDIWINGLYYVGSDGRMLANTITPDGYFVGADGKWIPTGQNAGYSMTQTAAGGPHNISSWSTDKIGNAIAEYYNRTYKPKGEYTYSDWSGDHIKKGSSCTFTIRYARAPEEQGDTPMANVYADEVKVDLNTGWAVSIFGGDGWYIW